MAYQPNRKKSEIHLRKSTPTLYPERLCKGGHDEPNRYRKKQLVELLNLFEHQKHILQERPAVGVKNLVFAGVVLINKSEDDPTKDSWISRRVVRTEMPQVFTWLFKKFVPILSQLPDYGVHRHEIFGRLGNTLAMAEDPAMAATVDDKVAAVVQDFWEICQDLTEGRIRSLAVAVGPTVLDDFVTRSLKSGLINQVDFENSFLARRCNVGHLFHK